MTGPHDNPDTPRDPFAPVEGSPAAASELLRTALSGPRRPVDGLIERLGRDDGAEWFDRTLRRLTASPDEPAALFVRGDAGLDSLIAFKEKAKGAVADGPTIEATIEASALYFIAVAAALRHHRRLITTRDRDELAEALIDLAAALAPPWRDLAIEASATPVS